MIDRDTNATVGAGPARFPLRRATNVRWQAMSVTKSMRAELNGHRGCVVWFTGLSGAGKSTIADLVEQRLHRSGHHTYVLDGDNVRHGLNKDLGFTDADRVENVRRVAEVAALMVDAGMIVLVSFISPFRAERALARGIVAEDEFCEVFVDTPLAVAEQRDPKGLYAKARRGELPNFTGIDSPYERPEHPEVRLDTTALTAEEAADTVLTKLTELGVTWGCDDVPNPVTTVSTPVRDQSAGSPRQHRGAALRRRKPSRRSGSRRSSVRPDAALCHIARRRSARSANARR